MIKLTTRKEHDELINDNKFVIIKYSAEWCKPCSALAKTIDEMTSEELHGFKVGDVDCESDEFLTLCEESKVRNLPTLLLYVDGNVVERSSGAIGKIKLESLIKEAVSNAG